MDDRGLDMSPVIWTSEAVYLSTERSRTSQPVTPAKLASSQLILPEARWGSADPTRRQLLERSQNAGVSLVPVVEVESPAAALALAARGVGDTVISLPLAQYLGYTGRLHWVSSTLPCMRPSPSSPGPRRPPLPRDTGADATGQQAPAEPAAQQRDSWQHPKPLILLAGGCALSASSVWIRQGIDTLATANPASGLLPRPAVAQSCWIKTPGHRRLRRGRAVNQVSTCLVNQRAS